MVFKKQNSDCSSLMSFISFQCAGTRFATESPCPAATFGATVGLTAQSSCSLCPPGTYCGTTGLTAPSGNCSSGYFCSLAASTSKPVDGVSGNHCGLGHYCPSGSTEPLPCPAGSFCDATTLRDPTGPCSAGYYCSGGASTMAPTDGITGNLCPKVPS